jgi:hypothetical protein
MNLIAKYYNSPESNITLLNLDAMSNYAIYNYDSLKHILNHDIDLYNLLGSPVLNNNVLEFYSFYEGLKSIDTFDDIEAYRIQMEINHIINNVNSRLSNCLIRNKIVDFLSKPCAIFSNGNDHMITWGYFELKFYDTINQDVEPIDLSTYISEASSRRTEVGGEIGNLTVSLIWDTNDDLDLFVIEPDGTRVGPGAPESKNGGILDVDANFKTITPNPMENIFWETPPKGNYKIYISCFERRESKKGTPIKFEIEVLKTRSELQKYSGDVRAIDRENVHVPLEVLIT